MRLFQISNNEVIVVKNEKFYKDTIENYILDGGIIEKEGEKINIAVHDSQQDYCELNGIVLSYPNEFFENIIDSIDNLIAKKEKREYISSTLEELKQQKINAFKAIRDNEEVMPIEYNDNLFDFDDKARDRINSAIIALDLMGENATIEWTTADNTNVTVTANDLRTVIANVAIRSNELHIKYRNLKEQIEGCESKYELDNIQWEK